MTEKQLIKKAVEKWGVNNQIGMAMEECAELIQALNKLNRLGNLDTKVDKVLEEIADVEIMIAQIKHICGPTVSARKVMKFKYNKLNRLEDLLKEK